MSPQCCHKAAVVYWLTKLAALVSQHYSDMTLQLSYPAVGTISHIPVTGLKVYLSPHHMSVT